MKKSYKAELVACIGACMDGNPTAIMEEAGFHALDLNWRCLTVQVPQGSLEEAFAGMKAMGFRGMGVTVPHKQAIIPLLDGLTPAARIIGAVNAVSNREGRWIGDNTDGRGLIAALQEMHIDLDGKQVTILGGGGHARAFAVECALAGAAKISIVAHEQNEGEELARHIQEQTHVQAQFVLWTDGIAVPEGTDVLVNSTDIGMHPDSQSFPDIDYTCITPRMVVADVVFNPQEPLFLQKARMCGAKTVTGIGMMVHQGALAFTFWTGYDAPVEIMGEVLRAELGET